MSEHPDKELMAFGVSIREAREAQAMTPAELATASNIDQQDLEAVEAGRLAPAEDFLLALSAGLHIDAEALGVYVDSAAVLATFGRRVRELRVWRGLSQDALGRLSSLHRTAIHKFEKGGTDPRLTSIRRIARGLGVPPRALIEDDAEHPQRVADET
jgi:transcriptional regulator with XRE-family HTH domain